MAVHLLDGLFLGMTNSEALVGQREKLIALGALSAGLAHELNNPAAAESRAADVLSGRLQEGRHTMVKLAPKLGRDQLHELLDLLNEAIEQARTAPTLSTVEAGDLEDDLAARLEAAGVEDPWELAPALASAGVDDAWLDHVTAGAAGPYAVRWLAIALDIESLVGEIRSSAGRISELVGAMKDYSHLDKAPLAEIDIHEGLESTLVIFGHKLKEGVTVVRDYDRTLPTICARGGELNQVWTNIIHNAVDAMGGKGTLTIRTARDHDRILVEIRDTGPGIPPELQRRIFEPFFTTKDVGHGTGLGLDISHRIVVRRHHGDIRVESEPGDTRFLVWLPDRSACRLPGNVGPGPALGAGHHQPPGRWHQTSCTVERVAAYTGWAELIRRPETEIPLDEGALLIAAAGDSTLDVASGLANLDRLAEQVGGVDCASVCHLVFDTLGIRGDRQTYDDPQNSYLHRVISDEWASPSRCRCC